MAGWKSTTSEVCRGWYHHVCKWTICACGWMKNHYQRKLQLVKTSTCASEMFATVERRESARFVWWPMGPHTSCTDCCIVLVISAWSVVVVVVVVACCCCISYRLALTLVPTFAPCVLTFAPYILTFGPCACGVSLLALVVLFHSTTSADSPLARVVVCIIIIHYTVIIMVFYCFLCKL